MKDKKICAEKRKRKAENVNRKRSARSGDLCPATKERAKGADTSCTMLNGRSLTLTYNKNFHAQRLLPQLIYLI